MRTDCVYIDTETCGLAGMAVLIQYAYDDGEIHLHEVWKEPVWKTLELIENFTTKTVVMFNAAFDWFHLCKIYTAWSLLPKDAIPAELPVLQVAEAERDGRDGPCLKPKGIMDLMLHSRKGEHQTIMSRHDIRVRKIPIDLAEMVRDELDNLMDLDPVLKAKWGVYDHKTNKGEVSTEFKDVVLKFKADKGLKSLAKHCLGLKPEFHSFKEIWADRDCKFAELKYAPFALACEDETWLVRDMNGKTQGWGWPRHIHKDIEHWSTNEEARRYAKDDVTYTRMLDEYYGYPEANDNDSILACMVAAVRWHGFKINIEKTTELLAESVKVLEASPINVNKPSEVKAYIQEAMDDMEGLILDKSTKKAILEKIRSKFIIEDTDEPEECTKCEGKGCVRCGGHGVMLPGITEASRRADQILAIKASVKEINQHKKLLRAGRFHASFKVIGTLSSRMAGGDDLNAQGIKGDEKVRDAFDLAWDGMILLGGDFDSFEVTIADAVFQDDQLRKDLLNGLSIHTVMGQQLYPDKTLEQILGSKKHADGGDIDMYTRGKQAVFAVLYGGDETTINKKLSIKMQIARAAFEGFQNRYPGIREARALNEKLFGTMQQMGDVGTKITWRDPADKCTTFLGFSRYFTLENKICKVLYDLAQNVPSNWRLGHTDKYTGEWIEYTCNRRNRQQKLSGAACSAIYGAAFQLQASNVRAANNHLIQSPGAQITKSLQVAIWEFQPAGVHEWCVAPFNVHDEVLAPAKPELALAIAEKVKETVESFRDRVPLIAIKWETGRKSWGHNLDDDDPNMLHIEPPITLDLDDSSDPQADLPTLEETAEEWAERGDDEPV